MGCLRLRSWHAGWGSFQETILAGACKKWLQGSEHNFEKEESIISVPQRYGACCWHLAVGAVQLAGQLPLYCQGSGSKHGINGCGLG